MNKYFLHGKLTAAAGKGDELADILLEASKLVAAAPGCHIYLIGKDQNDPDSVWVTEVWDSKEDHDNSLKAEGVRALIARAMPLLGGPPQPGQELVILGGRGLSKGS